MDVCSACSGSGQLLCCDGCERAFHFTCLDPPVNVEDPPTGEWYCQRCWKSRMEFPRHERGVFDELETETSAKNPSAFILPVALREHFEGVKTGEEGEYEEANMVKPNKYGNKLLLRSWKLTMFAGHEAVTRKTPTISSSKTAKKTWFSAFVVVALPWEIVR